MRAFVMFGPIASVVAFVESRGALPAMQAEAKLVHKRFPFGGIDAPRCSEFFCNAEATKDGRCTRHFFYLLGES